MFARLISDYKFDAMGSCIYQLILIIGIANNLVAEFIQWHQNYIMDKEACYDTDHLILGSHVTKFDCNLSCLDMTGAPHHNYERVLVCS